MNIENIVDFIAGLEKRVTELEKEVQSLKESMKIDPDELAEEINLRLKEIE